jgi:hypothetical protein
MDYNLILYLGIALMLFGFLLFLISEIRLSDIDRQLFRNKQLAESFNKAKRNEDKQLEFELTDF